ncbi:MAG: 50S ribosomal protein L22 [Candidatus Pacebacteria bacterium]|jgi:large subunit ribosomal protein L22|nr:50S ribosomal protein L22 [Candidatus Paceibacterota bacterium]MBT4652386.1 50S ribosomal protein L22 [Candidatus Paceibacterota bacterium]MBT6756213.1 50S ribosomal protein L22 [Candidatus Paceibacterota bacterium]MBT6921504.1 50S ribosomal protein L22 [Candidatus Paceibacterota bacterium]
MQIKAEQKNTRQSARKVRLVANAVRKLSLQDAMEQLAVIERKASIVVAKVLRQAIANATHNHNIPVDQLELKSILVGEGPTYKRFRAVSRGRAHNIFKRSCHVKVILETKQTEKEVSKKVVKKAPATKKAKAKTTTKKVVKKVKK